MPLNVSADCSGDKYDNNSSTTSSLNKSGSNYVTFANDTAAI